MAFDPIQRRNPAGLAFRPDITQGAIIAGVRLPRYGDGRYLGFLITARCDLAHIRTDTVNALPLVPVSEWLHFDGTVLILLARLLALEIKFGEIGTALPPGIREMIADDWKVGFDLFVASNEGISVETKNRLNEVIEEHAWLNGLLSTSADSPQAIASAIEADARFRRLLEREKQKKLDALLDNKIADAHFLPVVHPAEPLNEGPGYVVLFRQILSIPGLALEPIKRGVSSMSDLPAAVRSQAAEILQPPSEILSNIRSPHVEHILQRFSNLFSRVGVAECSKTYRDWLSAKTCNKGEQ